MKNRAREFLKEYWTVWIVAAVLLTVSVAAHTHWFSSTMTMTEEVWSAKVDFHETRYPFSIRPFQNAATLTLHRLSGLPLRESFFGVQYALAFILGSLFYHFLRRLEFGVVWSHVGLVLLLTSFPIMGAHFAPTHTWDDFWLYIFLVLSMLSTLDRRWSWATVFLLAGCFARETALVFYPLTAAFLWLDRKSVGKGRLALYLLAPIVVYGGYYLLSWAPDARQAWDTIGFNFEHTKRFSDTMLSLWIAYGTLWFLSLAGLVSVWSRRGERRYKFLAWGLIWSLPVNTVLVLLFAFARETRLLFPPFLFLIPLALEALRRLYDYAGSKTFKSWRLMLAMAVAVIAVYVGIEVTPSLLGPHDYGGPAPVVRYLAAGLHLGLTVSLFGYLAAVGWNYLRVAISAPRIAVKPSGTDRTSGR